MSKKCNFAQRNRRRRKKGLKPLDRQNFLCIVDSGSPSGKSSIKIDHYRYFGGIPRM